MVACGMLMLNIGIHPDVPNAYANGLIKNQIGVYSHIIIKSNKMILFILIFSNKACIVRCFFNPAKS